MADSGHIRINRVPWRILLSKFPKQIVANARSLLIYYFEAAAWRDAEYPGPDGRMLKRGQLYFGREAMSEDTGLTVQNIRSIHKHLQQFGEITSQVTNRGTVITLVNYDTYTVTEQSGNQQLNHGVTKGSPEGNQRVTTLEEVEEVKEVEEETPPPTPPARNPVVVALAERINSEFNQPGLFWQAHQLEFLRQHLERLTPDQAVEAVRQAGDQIRHPRIRNKISYIIGNPGNGSPGVLGNYHPEQQEEWERDDGIVRCKGCGTAYNIVKMPIEERRARWVTCGKKIGLKCGCGAVTVSDFLIPADYTRRPVNANRGKEPAVGPWASEVGG